jgi:hypothetical protein
LRAQCLNRYIHAAATGHTLDLLDHILMDEISTTSAPMRGPSPRERDRTRQL